MVKHMQDVVYPFWSHLSSETSVLGTDLQKMSPTLLLFFESDRAFPLRTFQGSSGAAVARTFHILHGLVG